MFNKNKNKSSLAADSISIVASSMVIKGDIEAEHDMRIDGRVEGHVWCKAKMVLGPNGIILGDLHAQNADIFGHIDGDVYVSELLCLKSNCIINGDLQVGRLDIEPEAAFNGKCTMVPDQSPKASIPQKAASLQEINN